MEMIFLGLSVVLAVCNGWMLVKLQSQKKEIAFHRKAANEAMAKTSGIIQLLSSGWVYDQQWSSYWGMSGILCFIAPDEKTARPLSEALERQRELEKISRLNLPDTVQEELGWRQ